MKTAVKVLIAVLLVMDLALAVLVFGPFEFGWEDRAVIQAVQQEPQPTVPVQTVLTTELVFTPETTAPQMQPAETEPETVPETLPDEEFTLSFVGDCTFGASPGVYYAQLGFVKTVGDDLSYPFRNVVSYFENDDFTMVNLEGVLADQGYPVPKEHNFKGPTKFAGILSGSSVEAVTLANNHSMDYGKKGYESTLAALQAENIPYVEDDGILMVQTRRGLTIGIYGMTYANMSKENMITGITMLKDRGAELIIVAAHWGEEMRYQPNEEQMDLGRAAIDAGTHIVYGSHPHVLQPIEAYNGGIIYYSLGNFSFGGNGDPKDYDTAILRQKVIRKGDGTIVVGGYEALPASVSSVTEKNNFQPTLYEAGSEEYDRVLSKLSGTYE